MNRDITNALRQGEDVRKWFEVQFNGDAQSAWDFQEDMQQFGVHPNNLPVAEGRSHHTVHVTQDMNRQVVEFVAKKHGGHIVKVGPKVLSKNPPIKETWHKSKDKKGPPSGGYRGLSHSIALDGGLGSGNRSGQPRGRSSRAPERRYVVEWQASPEVDDVLIRFLNDVGHVYRMLSEHPLRGLGMQHRMVDMMKSPKNLANELRLRFGDKVNARLVSTVKKSGDYT